MFKPAVHLQECDQWLLFCLQLVVGSLSVCFSVATEDIGALLFFTQQTCRCLNLLVLFFFTPGWVCNVSYKLIYDGENLYVMMI